MCKSSKKTIQTLGKAFVQDMRKDGAKKCIIPGKWLLQSLLVWPDTDNKYIAVANWLFFINLIIVEIFHASYVIVYRSDLGNAIVAFATVTTTFECLVRFYIIVFKKHTFNDILYKIWKQFWPLETMNMRKVKYLTNKSYATLALTIGCYGPAIVCNTIATLWPYLMKEGLILKSVYPFEWNRTCIYEAIYTWQYFTQWYVLVLVNTFDFFSIPVIMVCAVQFAILQDIFKNIYSEKTEQQRLLLFGRKISDTEMVLKCLNQQRMLFGICDQLEDMFSFAILFQYFNSTAALCTSCVILKIDASKFLEMLTFAIAHMFQLFYYCYVGNELTVQSENMAGAIYNCNWHLSTNSKFKKDIILMIQKSQKSQTLTAAGITELDFVSYVKVLRISFSFYTLLNHLIDRKVNSM